MKNESYNENYTEGIPVISGTLFETGERCKMQMIGYWIGGGGRRISSYIRIDKEEPDGKYRQYSMDRKHIFYLESED